jgi:hypothetical protein
LGVGRRCGRRSIDGAWRAGVGIGDGVGRCFDLGVIRACVRAAVGRSLGPRANGGDQQDGSKPTRAHFQ